MNALTRRLQKIEQQVAPIKEKDMAILFEPTEGSSAEAWQKHQDELARAQRENDRVLVVSFRKSRREEGRGNVTYVPSEIDATAEVFASKPSAMGFETLLDDVMDRLAGNVLGPTAQTIARVDTEHRPTRDRVARGESSDEDPV